MTKIKLHQEIYPKASLGELEPLRPVLTKLRWVHEKYINAEREHNSQDFLYGHRERPYVGLLAAAAWTCRPLGSFVALQEYRSEKGRKGDRVTGRGDLYIRVRQGTTFEGEAKAIYVRIGADCATIVTPASRKLSEASGQVKRQRDGEHLFGLVFVTPMLKGKSDSLDEYLLQLTAGLQEICDVLVWIGTPKGRHALRDRDGTIYPGVFLVITEVRR